MDLWRGLPCLVDTMLKLPIPAGFPSVSSDCRSGPWVGDICICDLFLQAVRSDRVIMNLESMGRSRNSICLQADMYDLLLVV